jgi:SIR2-like domain
MYSDHRRGRLLSIDLSLRDIARKWAGGSLKHKYPLEDGSQLSRVAQFLEIKESEEFPKKALSKEISAIKPPNFSLKEHENTAYSVLADLNLPIYITTNYDLFMETALKAKGKSPVSEFCRWNKSIIEYTRRADIPFVSDDRKYAPSSANPLVFHLHGDMDHPLSLVLTEIDYLDFIFNISNSDRNPNMIPAIVRRSRNIFSVIHRLHAK